MTVEGDGLLCVEVPILGPFRCISIYLKDKNWSYETPRLDKVERKFLFGGKPADNMYFYARNQKNQKIEKAIQQCCFNPIQKKNQQA